MSIILYKDGQQKRLDNQNNDIDYSELLDFFYPIGSYYETSNSNFDPNKEWGGTWERITDGSVLISEGYYEGGTLVLPGDSCGSNSHQITIFELPGHTHTYQSIVSNTTSSSGGGKTGSTALTINQIPKHTHNLKYRFIFWDGGSSYQIGKADPSWSGEIQYNAEGTKWYITAETGGSQGHTHTIPSHTHTITTGNSTTGESGHSNNMSLVQKSICCCRWHRTA